MAVRNALALYGIELITSVKSFILQAPLGRGRQHECLNAVLRCVINGALTEGEGTIQMSCIHKHV